MELRNGGLVGGSSGTMPGDRRPAFEAGLVRVFERWTALGLAVENCFGGGDSHRKADLLIDDVLQWFYTNKGALLACRTPCVSCFLCCSGCIPNKGELPPVVLHLFHV
jgi:Pre-rRNA-processing protein TSR2